MTDKPDPEINRELIQLLCLEAGRLMEDSSSDLALVLPDRRDLIRARVEQLHNAAMQISALADAALALAFDPAGE